MPENKHRWVKILVGVLIATFVVVGVRALYCLYVGCNQPKQIGLGPQRTGTDCVPNQFIVKFKAGTTSDAINTFLLDHRVEVRSDIDQEAFDAAGIDRPDSTSRLLLITLKETSDRATKTSQNGSCLAVDWAEKSPIVQYAEPNYILRIASPSGRYVSNDQLYLDGRLWGEYGDRRVRIHRKRNQNAPKKADLRTRSSKARRKPLVLVSKVEPTPKAHATHSDDELHTASIGCRSINRPARRITSLTDAFGTGVNEAWFHGHVGSRSVYVGVLDSGIDFSHPELIPNIWQERGWDFFHHKPLTLQNAIEEPHATHVAGIIGAVGGNRTGVAGVVWKVTLISAKFIGPNHAGPTDFAVTAIKYLTILKRLRKINIVAINSSIEGYTYSKALLDAIKDAGMENILFVSAAGNLGTDNDGDLKAYPASFSTDEAINGSPGIGFNSIISVAAIQEDGHIASFSNYGRKSVDLAAPGVDIWSTYPQDKYCFDEGTSMAAPHVTGAVALYASTHPQASARQIREAVLSAVIPLPDPSDRGRLSTGGTLNLRKF